VFGYSLVRPSTDVHEESLVDIRQTAEKRPLIRCLHDADVPTARSAMVAKDTKQFFPMFPQGTSD
jgi:hypothetical protein